MQILENYRAIEPYQDAEVTAQQHFAQFFAHHAYGLGDACYPRNPIGLVTELTLHRKIADPAQAFFE
ncbi:MAG: hypothetical protein V4695_01025 [Pseudomonadota bacterium]